MGKPTVIAATMIILASGFFVPASARTTSLSWQGYQWAPRTAPGNPGAPQKWSAGNVRIDAAGRLHLAVTVDRQGRYAQAELDSTRRGWGYGTYRWAVATDASTLAPEYVLGLFTYGQDPAYGHREIDIEASGWGSRPITWDYTTWANGNNTYRTPAPTGPTTQQFDWQPGQLTWTTWNSVGSVVATRTVTGADVPVPGDESVGLNLWLCGCYAGWASTPPTEVVISSFTFTPRA